MATWPALLLLLRQSLHTTNTHMTRIIHTDEDGDDDDDGDNDDASLGIQSAAITR